MRQDCMAGWRPCRSSGTLLLHTLAIEVRGSGDLDAEPMCTSQPLFLMCHARSCPERTGRGLKTVRLVHCSMHKQILAQYQT